MPPQATPASRRPHANPDPKPKPKPNPKPNPKPKPNPSPNPTPNPSQATPASRRCNAATSSPHPPATDS
eukprot:scaffold34855_cov66-Phaeocystis_antarctica.AAC.4